MISSHLERSDAALCGSKVCWGEGGPEARVWSCDVCVKMEIPHWMSGSLPRPLFTICLHSTMQTPATHLKFLSSTVLYFDSKRFRQHMIHEQALTIIFIHSLHILFDVWHRTQRIRQNPWLFHAVPARFNGFVSVIFGDFNLKFVSSKQRSAHKCIKTKEYDIMSYVKTSETFRNTTKHYMACQVKSMAPKLVEVMRSCKVGDQAMLPFWYLVEWIVPSARWKWLDIWDMFGNMCFFSPCFFNVFQEWLGCFGHSCRSLNAVFVKYLRHSIPCDALKTGTLFTST